MSILNDKFGDSIFFKLFSQHIKVKVNMLGALPTFPTKA
jgi:hypothetical protein